MPEEEHLEEGPSSKWPLLPDHEVRRCGRGRALLGHSRIRGVAGPAVTVLTACDEAPGPHTSLRFRRS